MKTKKLKNYLQKVDFTQKRCYAILNRGYLMPMIFDKTDIWVARNKIFYTTVYAAQMRGKTFLTRME